MSSKTFTITCLILVALNIYLFASAPPPLAEEKPAGTTISIQQVFAIVEAENDAVRALWTREIVGSGKKVGLKFNEDWREQGVEAGPLPALFLRETAMSLEKRPARLSLFLGSEYPINKANRFEGIQLEKFQHLKQTREPQFFFARDTGLYTAMYTDEATVEPCVECHNEHKQSPRNDWKIHDVMGATTWMYPSDQVTFDESMKILTALRQGFRDTYTSYLKKVGTFANQPAIGEKWPREGYFLPATDIFMTEITRRTSAQTLAALAKAVQPLANTELVIPAYAPDLKSQPAQTALFSPPQLSAANANVIPPNR
ncbi:MAG: c-type heme family protein [Methylococcales bacterium]